MIGHVPDSKVKQAQYCDTSLSPGSRQAALRAAGAVVYSVDRIMDGSTTSAFCLVRRFSVSVCDCRITQNINTNSTTRYVPPDIMPDHQASRVHHLVDFVFSTQSQSVQHMHFVCTDTDRTNKIDVADVLQF